jgi:hypothetical protein
MKVETMKTKTVYVATTTFNVVVGRKTLSFTKGQELTPAKWADLPNGAIRARFEKTEKPAGRVRFNSGTIRELPTENGAVKEIYAPHEFHLLPPAVRELIEEIAPLWRAECGFDFPGVGLHAYRGGDHHLTWWIAGGLMPANLPPMYTTSNKLTAATTKKWVEAHPGAYRYHTAALLKVAERLRGGRPVFAYSEAIDRLLAA